MEKKYTVELNGYQLANLSWLLRETQPTHCTGDWHCELRWMLHAAVGIGLPYGADEREPIAKATGCYPNSEETRK